MSLILHRIHGVSKEHYRELTKITKTRIVMSNTELYRAANKGEAVPGVEPGKLFRTGTQMMFLGIATRYGPIIMHQKGNEVECTMNHQLAEYISKKHTDLSLVGKVNTLMQFVGVQDEKSRILFWNPGELVEICLNPPEA